MNEDVDINVIGVEHVDTKPNTIYFFPVITFILLFYFHEVGIHLNAGYISAMLGVSILSTLLLTAFVGFGLLTDEWYSLKARGDSFWGELLIGVISLLSSQMTFYIIGYVPNWFPSAENAVWFTWGFIIYQLMWFGFTYFYAENGGFTKDNRANVFFGMVVAIAIGVAGVYAVI